MNKSHKVKTTHIIQEHPGAASRKAGKVYKGENFVSQKDSSAKKNAGKAAAVKKSTKK